jgi:hypothetical protein
MANNTDYVPRGDHAFLIFARNLYDYALDNFSRWQIPSPQVELEALLTDCEAKFEVAVNPNRGKLDVAYKNRSRDVLKKAMRVYCKAYLLYNPKVTDVDREYMGLTVYHKGRHRVSEPDSVPVLEIRLKKLREIPIFYHDSKSTRRGKPAHVHGIEILWAILDHFPMNIEQELIHSMFDTASPCVLKFGEEDRGKHVYMVGRWEIEREGEKGSFGEIKEAFVP